MFRVFPSVLTVITTKNSFRFKLTVCSSSWLTPKILRTEKEMRKSVLTAETSAFQLGPTRNAKRQIPFSMAADNVELVHR